MCVICAYVVIMGRLDILITKCVCLWMFSWYGADLSLDKQVNCLGGNKVTFLIIKDSCSVAAILSYLVPPDMNRTNLRFRTIGPFGF